MKSASKHVCFAEADGWPKLPSGMTFGQIPGLAVDDTGQVYILNREGPPLVVLGQDGRYIRSWGQGVLSDPHGIHIGPDNQVYVVDRDDHVVVVFNSEGDLTLTLGTRGRPSPDKSGGPFNRPTGVALSSEGDIYVSDGYGNARVHKFTPDGSLILSWGGPGDHPGQFNLPHGICVDSLDRVYVADRENNRVQLFSDEGDYIKEWRGLLQPADVTVDPNGVIYVAELGRRVTVMDYDGELLGRLANDDVNMPTDFIAPHTIAVDSGGDVYIGEVNKGKKVTKMLRNP